MVFEFGETVNGMMDAILESKYMYAVASNPLFTAIVCAVVMMIIAFFVFEADSSEILRFGFWAALLLSGIMILHNRVIDREFEISHRKHVANEVFAPRTDLGDENIPVVPTAPASDE